MLQSLKGQSFVNEVHLERKVKELLPNFKQMVPVLDGFYAETQSGTLHKIFATSTIGQLTVTEVR